MPIVERRATLVAVETAELLSRVATLVDRLLDATVEGRWPHAELVALVESLRAEVLPRAHHQECEVFTRWASLGQVAQMRRDHRRLQEATEVLARAAAGEGNGSTAHIAATARGVLSQLDRHLASEHEVLALT